MTVLIDLNSPGDEYVIYVGDLVGPAFTEFVKLLDMTTLLHVIDCQRAIGQLRVQMTHCLLKCNVSKMMFETPWNVISEAIDFYKSLGFKYVETPWFVDMATVCITCNNVDAMQILPSGQVLVGSAEQGFLQLAIDKQLEGTNFVSCSPCFRIEEPDELHHLQFLKVELFVLCGSESEAIFASKELVFRARKFMGFKNTVVVETNDGFDIEINGIEVGSYGARYDQSVGWWAYGTGVAEPRFTQAKEKTPT